MKSRIFASLLLALLLVCLCSAAFANGQGSIKPWLLNFGDEKWGPVPTDRLKTRVLHTNGNIVSKYHQNNGVLYHSYIGDPQNHVISDETFSRVVIEPPQNAAYQAKFFCEGAFFDGTSYYFRYCNNNPDPALADIISVENILAEIASPFSDFVDDIRDENGPPYYEWERPLFAKGSNMCTTKQRASENKGNVYLAAWYDSSMQLIRVDWLMETSDDFSIPKTALNGHIYKGYASEADLPSKITRPSLIIPQSEENMQFRLGVYFYPSYRGNSDFAELYLILEDFDIPVPDYDYTGGPIVIYWPYPEGYTNTSPVHYQIKHYLNNTHTEFEILNVTPTPKGLRIETKSLSPFEMSWEELDTIATLPSTGDSSSLVLWTSLMLVCIFAIMGMRKRITA